jgi:hypothetical protein
MSESGQKHRGPARLGSRFEKHVADEKAAHVATKAVLKSRVVGDDLTKALVFAGVDTRYLKAARALLEKSVKVKEEGANMTAVIETDLGETPIAE